MPDRYNDMIGMFGRVLALFPGSTDPGSTGTQRPSRKEGCAHLCNGKWSYLLGPHRGHPALRQVDTFKIWRDKHHIQEADEPSHPESGNGINIHAGGTTPSVGAWSAGCQVVKGGWTGKRWQTFYGHVLAGGQERFFYYLEDAVDLFQFAENLKLR